MTLTIVHDKDRILLGRKKRGLGQGYWNGFGGKVKPGEEIGDAARREFTEESGLKALDLTCLGELEFILAGEALRVLLYKAESYDGEITETEEMEPRWFSVAGVPFHQMWPDDRIWMPYFLKNDRIKARFVIDENHNLVSHKINLLL